MPRASMQQREIKEKGERSSRLRPGRVRRATTPPPRVTGTAKNLFRLVRLVSRSSPGGAKATPAFSRLSASAKAAQFQRRAIVNVRYASARTPGGWKAHGTYIERESAKGDRLPNEKETGVAIDSQVPDPDRLGLAQEHQLGSLAESWQKAGDKRIFKIILSPEDANVDFQRTAEEMVARIEQHIGEPVEWGGIVHRNTDHPHAHIIVRGRLPSGEPLKLPPALIRRGLREAVQSSLTRAARPANHRRHRVPEADRAYRQPCHALGPKAGRTSDPISGRTRRTKMREPPQARRKWPGSGTSKSLASRNHTPETVGLSGPISSRSFNR